jgi:hypothetical protein
MRGALWDTAPPEASSEIVETVRRRIPQQGNPVKMIGNNFRNKYRKRGDSDIPL